MGGRGLAFSALAVVLGLPLLAVAFGTGFAVAAFHLEGQAILAAAFTGVAVLTLVLGLPSVITAFFADRTLLLLALAPIRAVDVFLARLLVAAAPDWALSSLLLALLFGYGVGSAVGPAYYLLAVVTVAMVVLAAVGLQLTVLAGVLRVVPAGRARDIANLASGLLGAALYVTWVLLVRSPASRGRAALGHLVAVGADLAWVPSAWPGRAMVLLAQHRPGAALGWVGATAVVAAALLLLAWLAYRWAFLVGVGVYGSGVSMRRRASTQGDRTSPLVGSPLRALVRKDLLSLRRDLRRLAGLLPSLAVGLVYPLFFLRSGAGTPFWLSMPAALFGPFLISTTFGLPAVALEGRGMQLLVIAGIPGWSVLKAKLALTVPLAMAVGLASALLAGLIGHAPPAQVALAVVAAAWVAAGLACISVGIGAVAPDFDSVDPRRSVRTPARLLALAADAAFCILTVGAVALVVVATMPSAPEVPLAAGALFAAALSVAVVAVTLVLGTRRLSSLTLERFG